MKYFIIDTSGEEDYTTIAAFFNGELANLLDETNPNNLPYVGLLQAEEHELGDIDISTTTATHYFVLRPLNKKWQGEEDLTGCVTILLDQSTTTQNIPLFTIIENCVFNYDGVHAGGVHLFRSEGSVIKNCLFDNFILTSTDETGTKSLSFGSQTTLVLKENCFYNCVWNNVTYNNPAATDDSKINSIKCYGNKYHCIIKNPVMTGIKQKRLDLHNKTYNSIIENPTQDGDDGPIKVLFYPGHITEYNGFTDENWNSDPPSATNIINYDLDTHFVSGTYLTANGAQGKIKGGDPQVPLSTINDIEYWPYLWWDMGLLYFNKNILLFNQNNQNLIFRTK